MAFRRDPALWLTLVATAVRLLSAYVLNWSADQQAVVNAVAAALAGVIVALAVRHDGQVAAIMGFVSALLALAVGFGWHLSAEQQAMIMSFVGAVAAMFVRTQVGARVGPTPPMIDDTPADRTVR
jgi:uncharacterized membrane protein YeaQ/YmgE (transglycosylase-associated protein family)